MKTSSSTKDGMFLGIGDLGCDCRGGEGSIGTKMTGHIDGNFEPA